MLPQSPAKMFAQKKASGEKIAMISLYDAPSAQLGADAGADCLLVGDSMGNVVLGYDSTVSVTLDDIARATAAVVRGVKMSSRPNIPVIADLPFATYNSPAQALESSAVLMRAGASAVKLEGVPRGMEDIVGDLVRAGIPVLGHVGYTPQSHFALAGVVQARQVEGAQVLERQLDQIEGAGCCAVVLEAVAVEVAAEMTSDLTIPTIGIGSGAGCDGQVLVWHDLVGLSPEPGLKFVKRYTNLRAEAQRAASEFVLEVQSGAFPTEAHAWKMAADEAEAWRREREEERQIWEATRLGADDDALQN